MGSTLSGSYDAHDKRQVNRATIGEAHGCCERRVCQLIDLNRRPMGNGHAFRTLAEAKDIIEAWRQDCNTARPRNSLGGLAPEEYGRAMSEENQIGQSTNLRVVYSAG